MPKVKCRSCHGVGVEAEYANNPFLMKACPKCLGDGHLKLTASQARVLDTAREINDWFLSSDIECQGRTLDALVTFGLLKTQYASGGPREYLAI